MFAKCNFISKATIPIIKAVCTPKYNSKRVDITIQDGKHFGVECVRLVEQYLQKYEPLKFLVVAFKQLLFNANLNDPYEGGLSSYGLILMIIAFLQVPLANQNKLFMAKPEDPSPLEIKPPNLGLLFMEFLTHYSVFEFWNYEVRPFAPHEEIYRQPFQPKLSKMEPSTITVVDPLNPQNNVTRTAHKFMLLRVPGANPERTCFRFLCLRLTLSRKANSSTVRTRPRPQTSKTAVPASSGAASYC